MSQIARVARVSRGVYRGVPRRLQTVQLARPNPLRVNIARPIAQALVNNIPNALLSRTANRPTTNIRTSFVTTQLICTGRSRAVKRCRPIWEAQGYFPWLLGSNPRHASCMTLLLKIKI
ncbi:unnamed protein product [Somion occarium]|uniref:Uncharacterized protein n=1 Tax=Somion occarium TaxID=3059160 RepID=A0ABP1D886_9APHY